MSIYAERVAAPPERIAAARQQVRPAPLPRPSLCHVLQLRAAEAVRAAAAPAAPTRSGLPAGLKAGVEQLSGIAMDDVRVHRNSPEPAKLGALAYAKGSDIHLGPGEERHLPHEAWHVVQQKQGRVAATTQLKGLGVNADSALEAEADRQGSLAAALSPAGLRAGLLEKRAAHPVVQGKLRFMSTILEDKNMKDDPVPQRLLSYHQSPIIYEIRDDWSVDFKKPLHLLSTEHVYLLGEHHDKSKFEEQTKPWKGIARMQEYLKTFPGFEDVDPDPQHQPLESMHAYLLHVSLIGRSQLLLLEASKTPAAVVDVILWATGEIMASKDGYDDLEKVIRDSGNKEAHKADISFLDAMKKKHRNAVDIVKILATKLKTELAAKSPNAEALNRIKELKELLGGETGTFAALATDLATVIGIAPNSERGKAIAAEAKSKVAVAHAASAAMGVREAAMARNINAAKRPLLVKVGDGHVENLAKLVAKTVKVRVNETIDKYTLV